MNAVLQHGDIEARTRKGHAGSHLTIKQHAVDTPLPDGTITRAARLRNLDEFLAEVGRLATPAP